MTLKFASSNVAFLSRADGMEKIGTSDIYSRGLTKFDLMAKIRTLNEDLCETDYLENCCLYVRPWKADEIEYISQVVEEAAQRFSDLEISVTLPDTIYFVATTGWEEGGARGYTRGDTVFLNQRKISRELVLHELFHIVSRFDVDKRDDMYETLRFIKCNELNYDEDNRITNPDAPSLCHFVAFEYKRQESFGAIIIRSSREYVGGGFFSYVEKKILLLDERGGVFSPQIENGEFVFIDFADASGLYNRIGRNTAYNIHQEEICAEHFVALITGETELPDQQLVSDMLVALRG